MIINKSGNLLDSECECLINTINVVGVMGKGIALEFKNRYPELFTQYKIQCWNNNIHPGGVFVWKDDKSNKIVFNVATKNHWKDPSLYDYIWNGLYNIECNRIQHGIKNIAMPYLGCGNGGLNKGIVGRIISLFDEIFWEDIRIELYD
jgi:O-acetyl-ADP-ribose deacetylase (regulator of RNase III)